MLKNLIFLSLLLLPTLLVPARALEEIPAVVKVTDAAPELEAIGWMLVDHNSGWILAAHNPHQRIAPASLTKIMTEYLIFQELARGSLALDEKVYVSEKAWRTGGSRMFIQVEHRVEVEKLLQGLIIQSGNDAAVALAEHISGSEGAFAKLMNDTAAALGMENTNFRNSTGLPDENHYSTTYDLTLLARAMIRNFSQFYVWHSKKEYTYNNITQKNRNLLLWRDESVDGVKTGYTADAGYCLIGSAERDGMRLIATVVGTKSPRYRASAIQSLLRFGFSEYQSYRVFEESTRIAGMDVYMGTQDSVAVGSLEPLDIAFPKDGGAELKAEIAIPDYKIAPLSQDQQLGSLTVRMSGQAILEAPLFALESIEEGAWWQQIIDRVRLWWR